MNTFVAYSIPIQGLKSGMHRFKFTVDKAFFKLFEDSPVETGEVEFDVTMDKRSDMMVLEFELSGFVGAECDRCTAQINLPIEDSRELIVKYEEEDVDEEDEVVFIHRDAADFNVAQYLYEFVVLALPITNAYDCENDDVPPCNFEVLKLLSSEENGESPSSVWDELKKIKDN